VEFPSIPDRLELAVTGPACVESQSSVANARTVKVPAPSNLGGTAVNRNPTAGIAARFVRCSMIGISASRRVVWTGRAPSDVPSMLSESMPTQATPALTSASAAVVDRGLSPPVEEHAGNPGHTLEWEGSEVMPVGEPVERHVEVGTGVGADVDLSDVERRARCVDRRRRLSGEVRADDRRRQPGVCDHAIDNRMAEVDERSSGDEGVVHGAIVTPQGNLCKHTPARLARSILHVWRSPEETRSLRPGLAGLAGGT